ncbi:hypothetical protein VOLCADRAFT_91025 [Volvox carteri f. nagariensis]|uniref:Uncharacterized protein n=1 Tax=Volvox carteri f. nagariensis TaxID=3068 RepID=D8TVZ6_VOLCA|nr:uncharacterized protein VOLCADRAFT_91025 [Volvox carteri f. nagariensis]EFJ48281.1 hypothetical protein VOLCADRAFT_91025 [Volvox carteri f. nagariensis]|eukprot:XP_002950535.1 hypothetical protein VOLCADRAFT_91025 [Volvox carteri f. nagariensis]
MIIASRRLPREADRTILETAKDFLRGPHTTCTRTKCLQRYAWRIPGYQRSDGRPDTQKPSHSRRLAAQGPGGALPSDPGGFSGSGGESLTVRHLACGRRQEWRSTYLCSFSCVVHCWCTPKLTGN